MIKPFLLSIAICLAGLSMAQAQSTYEPYSFNTLPVFGAAVTYPSGLAVDSAGNIYLANTSDQTILKITSSGAAIILAGQSGVHGFNDGTGSAAQFFSPSGVAVDSSGTVYVADRDNNTVRKISAAGVVTTFAGSPGPPGAADGTGVAARFSGPRGVALDSAGNVYGTTLTGGTGRSGTVLNWCTVPPDGTRK